MITPFTQLCLISPCTVSQSFHIFSLTVTQSERVLLARQIFLAPLPSPTLQAGSVPGTAVDYGPSSMAGFDPSPPASRFRPAAHLGPAASSPRRVESPLAAAPVVASAGARVGPLAPPAQASSTPTSRVSRDT